MPSPRIAAMEDLVAGPFAGPLASAGPGGGGRGGLGPLAGELLRVGEGEMPFLAAEASLGCGNPVALADLSPGEDVLDLGSGGGIDVLLSARRVAPPAVRRTAWT